MADGQAETPEQARNRRRRWQIAAVAAVVSTAAISAVIWTGQAAAAMELLQGRWDVIWPPVAIVLLRMTDMCLIVFRTTFVMTGRRTAAATTAAVEGGVWIAAAGIVLADMTPSRIAAYAVGVSAGTLLGMSIIRKLRLGMVTVRVFTPAGDGEQAAEILRSSGWGATVFEGRGAKGPVDMVLTILRRREARQALDMMSRLPGVFTTVDSAPGPGSTVSGVEGQPL